MGSPPFESPESSSPIVTRAVAAGLRGEYTENYQLAGWQRALLLLFGSLPQGAARFALSRFQTLSGLPPESMEGFTIETLIRARLVDYAGLSGPFPAVTVGAALGGPSTHLSLALGGPFLPQNFVLSLRGGSLDGNAERYLERSRELALSIAAADPALFTIQHYDPVHDGWLTRWVNHLRFKLLDLPESYRAFLKEKLQPGGAVVYLEGGAQWPRYRLGPRSVFQVGGWGGIPPVEFLEGSRRLSEYARRVGLFAARWPLANYPLEEGPESEWGSEPGLAESLRTFCEENGYRFVRVRLNSPHEFARLTWDAAALLLRKEGRQPAGVLIEMFSQFDATAARRAGLLPLWLVFNTSDSLEFLKSMTPLFPAGRPVFFTPLSTFSLTPDLVPFDEWMRALQGFAWTNIGARRSHYPADARALVRWADPLRRWANANAQPVTARLEAEELAGLASANNDRHAKGKE